MAWEVAGFTFFTLVSYVAGYITALMAATCFGQSDSDCSTPTIHRQRSDQIRSDQKHFTDGWCWVDRMSVVGWLLVVGWWMGMEYDACSDESVLYVRFG